MIESTLWGHLKPEFKRVGKFQKVSDRFTPGVPDVLGCYRGKGMALELKEFSGVRIWKIEFRPGQLDWLSDWADSGGISLIVSTHRQVAMAHSWRAGGILEAGTAPDRVRELALVIKDRGETWRSFVSKLLTLK